MASPWEVVDVKPAAPTPAGGWDVVAEQPTSSIAAQFGGSAGAPNTDPQLDPSAVPVPTLGSRFGLNVKEGFDGTLAGEITNYNRSGQGVQSHADDAFRAIVEARRAGSPVALDSYEDGKPSPWAQMPLASVEQEFNRMSAEAGKRQDVYEAERAQHEADSRAMGSWKDQPGVFGKALAGVTALGGQLVGGAASPENLIGGPGGRVVRDTGESLLRYGARRVAPGAAEGAAGAAAADPVVQAGQISRGEQDGYSPLQTVESVAVGGAVGGGFRMAGMLWDGFRASRKKAGLPDLPPENTTADDILTQLQVDPEFAALARANGVDPHSADPRNAVLQERLAKRRIEEQFRPIPETPQPTSADFGTADRPGPAQQEIARRQAEREGVSADRGMVTEDGTINPAATNVQPRVPDERPIMVDRQGGAFRQDAGAEQGRQKAEVLGPTAQRALPAPGREHLTDEEIARQRKQAEGGQQPAVEQPPKLYGQEDRAPQTSDNLEGQRQAGEAFQLARHQRERVASDSRDTQVAGRPEGAGQQVVHMDEGHPVEILSRRLAPDSKGRMVEVATVRRYDPRTGQAAPDHVEYEVPVKQLTASRYAPEPRLAQDFETRAQGPRPPETPRQPGPGRPQTEPRQTYRATAPDDHPTESGRWSRPEQPEGPHPGRAWSSYEEAMRDFADRQARGESEPPKGGPDYSKSKSSNQARPRDRDGRFVVDENGHVMSTAEGPIRFADQKQAAKWILNVGQKESPDQFFEIAVHPSGKGFTARERGRTEAPKEPPPSGGGEPPNEKSTNADTAQKSTNADSGPPRQIAGPKMEATSDEAMRAEAERLWATKSADGGMGRRSRAADPNAKNGASNFKANDNQKMAYGMARDNVMRREASESIQRAIDEHQILPESISDISQFYRREQGETPQYAFDRAVDRWTDSEERLAREYLDLPEEDRNFDMAGESMTDPVLRDEYRNSRMEQARNEAIHDSIPFEHDGQGEPPQSARRGGTEEGSARSESDQAREQPGSGRENDLGFNTDAGPDGKRQTVIPGAERIGDGERAQRGTDKPLKGGNEPPPEGGLFDEGARNQTTLFSNPFFAPEAWAGLARSLGVHGDYFKDLRAYIGSIKEGWQSTSGKKTSGLADIGRAYFYSTDGELRAVGQVYKSETIKKIADMLHAPADMGRGGAVGRTYHEAVEQRTVSNLNKLANVLGDFRDKPEVLNQIRYLVQNPQNIRPGNKIHDAAAKIRGMLDDEFKYLKEAKVDVGQVPGYFPRIVNAEAVLRNPADFVEAAVKQYLRDKLARNRPEAEKLAQAWLASIELGHAGAKRDGTDFIMLGGTPNADFRKERVFGRSIETDKNNPLAKYYVQDPIDALTLHFQRTSRRAEWARRFGDDLSGWKKLKQDIVDEGNVAALRQVVDAIAVSTGVQRAYQTDAARTAIGHLRTWGAITLLPRATITSLSETAMPAIRSGNMTRMLGDVVRTAYTLAGGMKKERELAADLGLISNAIGDSVLGRRYFALEPGSKVQQATINRYFRRTGLEQLTNAQRVVAVAGGQVFLRRLARDVEKEGARQKSSAALLRELGIEDAPAFSKWLLQQNDGMPGLGDIAKDEGHGGQYRTAMQRFNQQTSLNPNSSTRPRWANHPLGSLLFMLQSYAYAFQKQVLNRAGNGIAQAVNPRNGLGIADRATMLAPAMVLPALAAIQWGLQAPRDAVFGDPTSQEKSPEQTFMQVLSRSGLTGVLDPWINTVSAVRYGRTAAETLAGPVLGKLADLGTNGAKLLVKNSDNTNTAERNFAKAAYDATIMPAVAVLSGLLPVGLGMGAIQAASSGTAREAFASATAGDKEQRGGIHPPRPPKPPKPPRH